MEQTMPVEKLPGNLRLNLRLVWGEHGADLAKGGHGRENSRLHRRGTQKLVPGNSLWMTDDGDTGRQQEYQNDCLAGIMPAAATGGHWPA